MFSSSEDQQGLLADMWQRKLVGIIVSQLVFASALAVGVFLIKGVLIAVSFLFGSAVVAINSFLLARSVRNSSSEVVSQLQGRMFRSAVGRFVLLISVLLLANALGLHLLAVAAGMFAAYVGGYAYMIKFISGAVKASEKGGG